MTDTSPNQAIAWITEPLLKNEAIAHGWLGDRGKGKSVANKILIEYLLQANLVGLAFTMDDKTARGTIFKGAMRSNVAHYMNNYEGCGKHVIFRGTALKRDSNDVVRPGERGQLAWDVVRAQDIQVLVNIDELSDATPGQGQAWLKGSDPLAQIFRKGRGAGISIVWTTQLPQTLPLEAFGLSETMGIFRLDGREVDYLVRKHVLTDDVADVIPRLETGQWILYRKGRGGWDGNIYKFRIKNRRGTTDGNTHTAKGEDNADDSE